MREKKYLCHQKFSNNSLTKQNIMKKFTQFAMTLALMFMGGVNVYAQEDEVIDMTKDMFCTWDGYGADAVSIGTANVDFKLGTELGEGAVVCGTSTVDYLTYADLTGYTKMMVEGTAGTPLRVLMNRQESNSGPLVEKKPTIGDDGKAELDLTEFDYVHLNAIKIQWGGSGTITAIKLVKPADPLGVQKEQLKNAINEGKQRNSFGKTEESFAALQDAIADGEAALADAEATAESLTAAKTAIEEAIEGLVLAEGYVNLTADMFKKYESVEEPGEPQTAYPAYELFKASDLPYGDSNVGELNWADLTEYDKLIVVVNGDVKPRFCMNRLVANGQQAETKEDSKMIDINPNNNFTWSTEEYQTIEGNVYTIDLKKIVEDYTFARLHSIKKQGWGAGVFVTDLLLYKEPAAPVAVEVTFDFNAMNHATSNNGNEGDIPEEGEFYSTDGVSMTITANPWGKTPNRYWNTNAGPQLRMYGGSLELEAAEGMAITSVVFNHNGKWGKPEESLINTVNGQDNTTGTWEGNSTNVVLEVAANTQMNSITVTLAAANEETTTYTWVGTGIQTVKAAQMENVYFDLAGRRVAQPAKGLYIVNGKKVVK